MTEFDIDGKNFRIKKIPVMQQFNLSRKIAPLVPPLLPVFMQIAKDKIRAAKGISVDEVALFSELMQPFADGLAAMKDEDADYVFNICLSAIEWQNNQHWVSIWSEKAKACMFQDMFDISIMLRLVVRVIADSLGPFIQGFLTAQSDQAEPDPAPTK